MAHGLLKTRQELLRATKLALQSLQFRRTFEQVVFYWNGHLVNLSLRFHRKRYNFLCSCLRARGGKFRSGARRSKIAGCLPYPNHPGQRPVGRRPIAMPHGNFRFHLEGVHGQNLHVMPFRQL